MSRRDDFESKVVWIQRAAIAGFCAWVSFVGVAVVFIGWVVVKVMQHFGVV